jgi:hypothetical protein
MPRTLRLPLIILAFLSLLAPPLAADVVPPLVARIEVVEEQPGGVLRGRIVMTVPSVGANREARVRLRLQPSGVTRVSGKKEWVI